jgi:hypothetical protein
MSNGNDLSYSNNSYFGFNLWHFYTGLSDSIDYHGWPGVNYDYTFSDVSRYRQDLIDKISLNNTNNLKTLSDRPKFQYISFAQRSDYQCESESYLDNDTRLKYGFYTYRHSDKGVDTVDNSSYGNGEKVKYCPANRFSAGYVVRDLRSNREQINRGWDWIYPMNDGNMQWHIEPRIRIDPSFTIGTANDDKIICKIKVTNFNGDTIKNVDIRVRHFKTSGVYNGDYLTEYNFGSDSNLVITYGPRFNPNKEWVGNTDCKVDFKVYWTAECDMWIDYVRVEDEIAVQLFRSVDNFDPWIEGEVKDIALAHPGNVQDFYIEEYEFNMLPAIKYVNHKIDSLSGHTLSLMTTLNEGLMYVHLPPDGWNNGANHTWFPIPSIKYYLYDYAELKTFFPTFYPLAAGFKSGEIADSQYVPSTLWSSPHASFDTVNGMLAQVTLPNNYDSKLNDCLDEAFKSMSNLSDYMQQEANVPLKVLLQAHSWFEMKNEHVLKEPTNEELSVLANTCISYGAKGIQWFWYGAKNDRPWGGLVYASGLLNSGGPSAYDGSLRTTNAYGQPKAQEIKNISARLMKWGPYVMSFNNSGRKTCVYRDEIQRGAFLTGTYFNEIVTFKPGTGIPPCEVGEALSGNIPECPNDRFIQAAVFKNDSTYRRYFMIVNRRCAPENSYSQPDGKRAVRIKLDANSSEFSNFNNWSIIDVERDSIVGKFNKKAVSSVDLGWFNPGQGKLYKVVPMMETGGTFMGDESFGNVAFNFNAPVNTNGKNLTIGGNTSIYFKDTCRLRMSGGSFKCGSYTETMGPTKAINFTGQGSSKWKGLSLSNMDTVSINNTLIYNVDSTAIYDDTLGVETKHGITIINTKVVNIDNTKIDNRSSTAGGVFMYNYGYFSDVPSVNITRNDILICTNSYDGIYIHPCGWLTMTPYIYLNKIINTSSAGGRYGIFGFSLEGTAIKNNYIENFRNGILTWYSSLDLFENTIDTKNISEGWDLYGIVSEYNMSNVYESRLGGSNVLTTLNGRNVCVDALDINIADGNNIFNINDSAGFHMLGYLPAAYPSYVDPPIVYAGGNCFKVEGIEDRKVLCVWSDLRDVEYDFGMTNCPLTPSYCDYYIGGNPNDTIWYECTGGTGGGEQSAEFRIQNRDLKNITAVQTNVYKEIYDSLSINMRKKQYALAAQKCMTLLDNYTDSAKTINAVDKLYHALLVKNEVSELKSYYESFIQSHPNHMQIIQRMFYYIQKAKVRLGQYESAMQGFQTIMNQFPTSYEGLAAKWDYMATQLLDSLNGQGGGEKEIISDEQLTDEQRYERLVRLVEDPLDKYDKKKFTKEDRKVIVANIVKSFDDKKTKEINKVKELEVKVIMNEASNDEKREYKTKKTLKEVVCPQTVNTISEHINAVQNDIERVFPVSKNTNDAGNKTIAVIPLEYKLNQNYPNPFNPSTKINYELQNAGDVSLKIYDLLGREIAELVNETKDAGRYTIDFNASKYMMASGIYFYCIKAGEFVDTKRMVLVK